MHLTSLAFRTDAYPSRDLYPFSLPVFQGPERLPFSGPVTLFQGENGSGKSTLLEAIARAAGYYIWGNKEPSRMDRNPHCQELHRFLHLEWTDGVPPGSFFASELFRSFAANLDLWAACDPGLLHYFGDKSLLVQSHGQYHMAFFRSRFKIPGLFLLDEPENALSPRRQKELIGVMQEAVQHGAAQFIVATHSPILLSFPGAAIFSFDGPALRPVAYRETDHYRLYREFFTSPDSFSIG